MTLIKRSLVILVALCWAITSTYAADPRVRKSIDDLTADELEAYIHAVQKIREKSITDPFVQFSYAHMAGLHNIPALFNGACMHHSYHFLAWHRAHLINYEDALRASDPPRTANVTIPYWNWAKKPTGKRYPVAFENDAAAVATHYGRRIDPSLLSVLANSMRNSDESLPWFPWSEVSEYAQRASAAFLGTAADGSDFEKDIHDTMHGFVGGALCCPSSASDDVIFWSFHSFFDLVWWWRQQSINDTIPCQNCTLNGMRPQTALRQDGPTMVKDVTKAEEQLGFTYQFTPEPPLPVAIAPRSYSERLPVLANLALRKPDLVRAFEIAPPRPAAGKFILAVEQVAAPIDVAYIAFVYVHPKAQPFDAADVNFRNNYLVGHVSRWASSHAREGHPDDREYLIPVDLSAYPALSAAGNAPLTVTIAIHVQAKAGGPSRLTAQSPVDLDRNTKIGSVGIRTP